jgi:hypothetical protein
MRLDSFIALSSLKSFFPAVTSHYGSVAKKTLLGGIASAEQLTEAVD